jgi:hypothetical protein
MYKASAGITLLTSIIGFQEMQSYQPTLAALDRVDADAITLRPARPVPPTCRQ